LTCFDVAELKLISLLCSNHTYDN